MSHVGTAWTDAGIGIQLQLEEPVGRGRVNLTELLFPALSRRYQSSASSGLFKSTRSACQQTIDLGLGSAAGSPQWIGPRVYPKPEWPDLRRISTAVRTGVESGRVHLGLLETERAPECLFQRSMAAR